jgi:tRNA 2-thiocytidine biosynthesis protein TtcA
LSDVIQKRISKIEKRIRRSFGKARHDYRMIADGDRIAVGISGGKDSLTLMYLLSIAQSIAPVDYEVHGIYLDPGFDGGFNQLLQRYCDTNGYPLTIEITDHGIQAHSRQNRKSPCFLCSRLRRKRLFEFADERRCNKLALGHTRDDIIETLFLNMCFSGQISTMRPAQSMFEGRLAIIRPLAYIDEKWIEIFAREQAFPQFENACPSAGHTRRQTIRSILQEIYRIDDNIKGNIFRSLSNVRSEYLLP